MLISIVVPVYNVAPFLDSCVESILAQSYTDWELILVDDGSKDDSPALCDKWAKADSRIRAIHQANGGLSAARNTGIRAAKGEYIAFLDGDDTYLLVDGLAKLVSALRGEDILLFQAVDIYPSTQSLRPAYDTQFIASHTALQVFAHLVHGQVFQMSACFQILRRAFLLDNGLFFEQGLLSEDVDWSLRVWRCVETVGAINLPLYGYKHREGSISTSYTLRNLQSYAFIFERFLSAYRTDCQTHVLSDTAIFASINSTASATISASTNSSHSVRNSSSSSLAQYWCVTLGYLAQMYTSCLYAYALVPKSQRREARSLLLRYSTLLQYSISQKSDRPKLALRFLGFRLMLFLFATYGVLRRRLKR